METEPATTQAVAGSIKPSRHVVELYEQVLKDLLATYSVPWDRDALDQTPTRMSDALFEMTSGYNEQVNKILNTTFVCHYDEMVVVREIPFSSLCEHHLMPFHGHVTLGYLPNSKVVGLSKLPRLVHALSRRLQIQERLTEEITRAIMTHLDARGAACTISAYHTCMALRGVRCHAQMVTSSLEGVLRSDPAARQEFLQLARPT